MSATIESIAKPMIGGAIDSEMPCMVTRAHAPSSRKKWKSKSGCLFAAERTPMPPREDDLHDPVLEDLRHLPPRAASPGLSNRVLATARAAYERKDDATFDLRGLLARAFIPVLLTGTAASYVTWAIHAASTLYP